MCVFICDDAVDTDADWFVLGILRQRSHDTDWTAWRAHSTKHLYALRRRTCYRLLRLLHGNGRQHTRSGFSLQKCWEKLGKPSLEIAGHWYSRFLLKGDVKLQPANHSRSHRPLRGWCYLSTHRVSKNVLPLAWYIVLTHVNGFWCFWRNVTDKVSDQKTLYYATSNNLCLCTTYENGKTKKLHFHSHAVLMHCQNSTSRCFISSIFFTHDSYDTVWPLNHVINMRSARGCWGRGSGEKKSRALQQLDCVAPLLCLLGFLFHKVMLKQ